MTEHSDGTWPAITCYTSRNTYTSILFHSYSTTGFSVATYPLDGKKLFKINYQNSINLTHSYLGRIIFRLSLGFIAVQLFKVISKLEHWYVRHNNVYCLHLFAFQKELRFTLNECKCIIGTNNKWKYINLNPSTPVVRGLVKIHKEDTPIRPIINFRNAPTYNLPKTLTNALKKYIPLPHVYNVQNSVHLMKDLSEIPYNPDLRIASLNISNMYTNIPTKDLLNIIQNICENNGLESAVKQEILSLTRLIIMQNYFRFQNRTYIQKSGLAMGAPSSSILSEIYLQFMENTKIFEILKNFKIEGYYRYVDDILIIYNKNHTNKEEVYMQFNNMTHDLKFILEQEKDKRLNFLDVTIQNR